jgi:NAD-dependent SIR2 family protein deacetylase
MDDILKKTLQEAQVVIITAGAGMGVDSGLPDFRGNEVFWKAYPPIEKLGISFEEMANPKWFAVNPSLAWAFYGHRLNLYRKTVPHEGFEILLDYVKEKNSNYFIFTSNVDGQFQKPGFDKDKIYEVHGSIHHLQCSNHRCNTKIWENDELIEINMEKFEAITIPICPKCGDIVRPNILMFNDWHWLSNRSSSQKARYNKWWKVNRDKKIIIIEVGAGTAIPTVRIEGEGKAQKYKNTKLIRINPREFNVNSNIGYSISMGGLNGIKTLLNTI